MAGTAGLELIGSGLGMELPVQLPWQMGAGTGPPAKAQPPHPNQPGHQGSTLASSRPDPGGWQCLHRSRRPGWQPLSLFQQLAPLLMWPYGPICSLTAGLPRQLPEDVLCRGPATAPAGLRRSQKSPAPNLFSDLVRVPTSLCASNSSLSNRALTNPLPLPCVSHFRVPNFHPNSLQVSRQTNKLIHFTDTETEARGTTASSATLGGPC